MELVATVILLALLQYIYFGAMVAKARGTYDINAPATTGNETFERYYRVQVNTMELLVVLIPSMLIFAIYINSVAAALLGGVYIVGRMIYFKSYVEDPSSRSMGYAFSILPCILMAIGGIIGAGMQAFLKVM